MDDSSYLPIIGSCKNKFKSGGEGMKIDQKCHFCRQPSSQLGSKLIGPMRRMKCKLCVEKEMTS